MISFEAVSSRSPDGGALVDNVTFEVADEVTTVLLGTPRAMRQQLVRLLLRLDRPEHGVIRVNNADLRQVDGAKFRRSIGWLSGPPRLFPHRSIQDNVQGVARLSGMGRRQSVDATAAVLSEVGLMNVDLLPAELAAADQVRAGLARAFVQNPELVVLDDPFGGLDGIERPMLRDLLGAMTAARSTTVFVATGDAEDALILADRVVLMVDGAVVQAGSPADVLARPAARSEALLGPGRGLRGLAFSTVADVPIEKRAIVSVSATASEARRAVRRGSPWVLVIDDDRRPLGWVDTERLSTTGPVTEVPLVGLRGTVTSAATMHVALDLMVSSPARMVPKLDDDGRVLGLLTQAALSRSIPERGMAS